VIEYLVCWTAGGVARSDSYETVLEAERIANEVAADGFEPRVERREFSNGRERAPNINTLFASNLDGLCRTDLATESYYHRGTSYGDYAMLKSSAMLLRGEGNIRTAMALEDRCEQIYNALPAWQRWLSASRPLACLRAEQSARRSPHSPVGARQTMDLRAIHAQRLAEQAAAKKAADEKLVVVFNTARRDYLDSAEGMGNESAAFVAGLRKVIADALDEKAERDHARDTDELFQAGTSLIQLGYYKWVRSTADSIEESLKVFDPADDSGWNEFVTTEIEGACDTAMTYTHDANCTLLVSKNSDVGIDEGLCEKGDDAETLAHFAFLADVRKELDRRGALEEPEPPSEAPESAAPESETTLWQTTASYWPTHTAFCWRVFTTRTLPR
jgi:hypothetical protein